MAAGSAWAYETDVVVVGSGAGALTAAVRARDLGCEVLVIEKTDMYGGTSGMSGGVLWLPDSPLIGGSGGSDSAEEGKRYLHEVVDEPSLSERIDAFVDNIPGFIEYIHSATHLRFAVLPQFPDMYPDNPAAKMHRCHEALPFHGRVLPDAELLALRPQHPQTALFGKIGWTPSESLILQARGPGWKKVAFDMVSRYLLDLPWRLRSLRDRRLVLGGALVGALRRSMLDRKMPLWLNTPFESFITDDAGAVTGVIAKRDGVSARIRARKGVILASGGFEKSEEMSKQYLDQPTDPRWSAGSPGNTGEVIRIAAEQLGAGLEFMDEGWWGPTVMMPGEPQARMLIIEKNLPGSIIVNRAGKRFVNEACSYHQFGQAMLRDNAATGANMPCWLIFDASFRRKYALGALLPSMLLPDRKLPPDWLDNMVYRADSIPGLAAKIAVPPDALAGTLLRFNELARKGVDEDFGRGGNFHNLFYGDARHTPNRTLGEVISPPFYAVRLDLGDIGTKGGPRTDENARVIARDGQAIPGLYAIGNAAGSVMGGSYPGAGATLGAALTFACLAVADASGA